MPCRAGRHLLGNLQWEIYNDKHMLHCAQSQFVGVITSHRQRAWPRGRRGVTGRDGEKGRRGKGGPGEGQSAVRRGGRVVQVGNRAAGRGPECRAVQGRDRARVPCDLVGEQRWAGSRRSEELVKAGAQLRGM